MFLKSDMFIIFRVRIINHNSFQWHQHIQSHAILTKLSKQTSLTESTTLALMVDTTTEGTSHFILRILKWFESCTIQIAIDFFQFNIKISIKVKLLSISAFLLESLVVLFELRDNLRLSLKYLYVLVITK